MLTDIRNSENTTFQGNYLHDVGDPSSGDYRDLPSAALMTAGNRDNKYLYNTIEHCARVGGVDDNDWGTRGMWIGNGSPSDYEFGALIEGNYVVDTGYTSIATHVARGTFRRNYIDNRGYKGGCAAIKIVPPAEHDGETLVEDNVSLGSRCTAFTLASFRANQSVVVRNNYADGHYKSTVSDDPGDDLGHNIQLINNTFLNNGANGYATIWFHQGHNVQIRGNLFRDTDPDDAYNNRWGIALAIGRFENINIRCNRFEGLGSALTVLAGGTVVNSAITDNYFTGNREPVISVEYSRGSSITSSTFASNQFSGNTGGTRTGSILVMARLIAGQSEATSIRRSSPREARRARPRRKPRSHARRPTGRSDRPHWGSEHPRVDRGCSLRRSSRNSSCRPR